MIKKLFFIAFTALFIGFGAAATAGTPNYSTAGFFHLEGAQRNVVSLNPGWKFSMANPSDKAGSFCASFNDKEWQNVNLPHTLNLVPLEGSGGMNYRGGAWYRKHFDRPENMSDKRVVLYFEAIMGKSKIWVNDSLVKEHFGGFLPISIDVTDCLNDKNNVISVWTDNADDPMYPPGKPQHTLDFCYFGGIYRDAYLISTDKNNYITDQNHTDIVAGGGVFVTYEDVSEKLASINIQLDYHGNAKPVFTLKDAQGNTVAHTSKNKIVVKKPNLWSPRNPYLYDLEVRLVKGKKTVDGYTKKAGIRSVEFSHKEGLILNGKPYDGKLIGANRHQDFALIGNALSNSLHYRDALKLKNSGMEIIRNAHYPQDPAFMDACDALGLFVIVNTPGWQFWNEDSIFEKRVYSDIRSMVRRDRNHPSVIMWEPILNETWYPERFAKNVHNIVKEEFPFEGCYTACDLEAKGSEYFDVIFSHPLELNGQGEHVDTTKVYFTREFGDNVDDWNSHNSPSRVARQWGETAQLIQAKHYANPPYSYTTLQTLGEAPTYHFGGTLWHSFDHQRGYHPDPFYGGIMDAFRRPKYSYYMFQAQAKHIEPMVYIASELSPFSAQDVTVFSNCSSVKLHTYSGDTLRLKKRNGRWFTFKGAFDFMADKKLSYAGKQHLAVMTATGFDEFGKEVAKEVKQMSRRASQLRLVIDTMSVAPQANGGDLVVVTAQMVDKNGMVKRLNNSEVVFEVEGEAHLVTYQNPVPILWGEASVILRMTTKAGKVTVKARVPIEGDNTPKSTEISFVTTPASLPLVFDEKLLPRANHIVETVKSVGSGRSREEIENELKEVEKQQSEFGETRK